MAKLAFILDKKTRKDGTIIAGVVPQGVALAYLIYNIQSILLPRLEQ